MCSFFCLGALRALRAQSARSVPLRLFNCTDRRLPCAPFNASLRSATATSFRSAPRRCACALRAVCSFFSFALLRSARAHICLVLHIPRAPRRRASRRSQLNFFVFCIISSLRMWKRGFSTISARKLQGSGARPSRTAYATKQAQKYNCLAP